MGIDSPNNYCSQIKEAQNNLPASFIRDNTIDRTETTQLSGNTKIGNINNYAQIHFGSGIKDKETGSLVYRAQDSLLKDLEKSKAKHIFQEGLTIEEEGKFNEFYGKIIPFVFLSNTEDFGKNRETIAEGLSSLSQQQLKEMFLKELGAGYVYYYLHHSEGVQLHGAESEKNWQEHGNEKDYVVSSRENVAVGIIKDFLKKNPGENIALIFGAMHDFSDKIKTEFGENTPTLKRIQYPALNHQVIEREVQLQCGSDIENAKQTVW